MRLITASSLQVGDIIRVPDTPDRIVTSIRRIGEGATATIVVKTKWPAPPPTKYYGPAENVVVLNNAPWIEDSHKEDDEPDMEVPC